jgi:Zn-dependent protease with chaperone function
MIKLPRSSAFRVTALLLAIIMIYLSGYIALRHGLGLSGHDMMVAFGIFTGALLMATYLSVNTWLVWATVEPETLPEPQFTQARELLDELGTRVGFHIDLRVVSAKRTFIYSAGINRKLLVISDTALAALSPMATRGVFSHEVAHMVMNHSRKNAAVFSSFFGLRMALAFPSYVNIYVALLLFMYLRHNEYEADKLACILVGREAVHAALNEVQALTKMREFGRTLEFFISTHPSYDRRRHAITAYE